MDPEQESALAAIRLGRNVFITGAAGVGKSFLLDKIRQEFKGRCAFTATTGAAAVNVQGCTIHSWAGLGIGKDSAETITNKLEKQLSWAKRQKFKKGSSDSAGVRVAYTDMLVLDEVSMMPHDLMYKLDTVCRNIRKEHAKPFGGIQVIFVGDFFQLPPVQSKLTECRICGHEAVQRVDGKYECKEKKEIQCRASSWDGILRYCFDSSITGDYNLWDKCDFVFAELTTVYRQKNKEFIDILHRVREGKHTDEDMRVLMDRCGEDTIDESDGILATQMYCRNIDVDNRNMDQYKQLPQDTTQVIYTGVACAHSKVSDTLGKPIPDSRLLGMLTRNCTSPGELMLRPGTQVMLCKNIDVKNGLCNGTIGVVEGFMCKGVRMDTTKNTTERIRVDGKSTVVYPIVKFSVRDGKTHTLCVEPHDWTAETSTECAVFTQIPLRHAWAITSHKCQGMSLPKVRIHLDDAFTDGQAYVALSRAVGLEGCLHLASFDPEKITVSSVVAQWYDEQRRKAYKHKVEGSVSGDETNSNKRPKHSK